MKSLISALCLPLLFCVTASTANAEEKRETIEQWRIYSDSEIKNPTMSAILYSSEGEDAALTIRCQQNRPAELYLVFSDRLPAAVDSALSIKIDGVKVNGGNWRRSSHGNGAFALKPSVLVKQLAQKQSLILTYQTEQGKYKVAGFYLAGFNQFSQKLTAICRIN